MKNKLLWFIITLLFPSVAVRGQEFIKEAQIKQETSIVKEVSFQTWLTYTHHSGGQSCFSLITETGTTAPILYLPSNYYVSDFEIYNDTAFFCGYRTSSPQIAIFGYFDLASFPFTTVYCCHISGLKSIDKITLFSNNNNPHVVYTGTISKGQQSLVGDAIRTSSNSWDFYIAYHTEISNINYDDVAVTDKYIISTFRNIVLDSGYVDYFDKPSSYSTMFSSYYITKRIEYQTITPIIATSCDGDFFATLCKDSPTSFVMSRYLYLNNNLSLRSFALSRYCRDINFNKNSRNIEVLLNDVHFLTRHSEIIHYAPTLSGNAVLPVHKYNEDQLFSIDYLTNHTDCFIASGHIYDGEYQELLRLYRYKYDEWHECPQEDYLEATKISNKNDDYRLQYEPMTTSEDATPLECGANVVNVYIKCEN
ncbi:MAG: hypothetical protein IKR83_02945 [Bacteroidales bacterium]|nr:hypothetical protein [Bacteroidales bacterium]